MKIPEQVPRILELTLSIIALVLSVVAIVVPTRLARESNSLAREALATARQSNDIAVGARQAYPQIDIGNFAEKWNVVGARDLVERDSVDSRSEQVTNRLARTLIVENSGVVPIDAILIRLVPLDGLTRSVVIHDKAVKTFPDYLKASSDEVYSRLPQRDINVSLSEQLLPHGTLYLDVTTPLLQLLGAIDVKHPNEVHSSLVNVILLPRRVGSSLPTNTQLGDRDRVVIEVTFLPSEIRSVRGGNDTQVRALVAPPSQ